MIFEQLVPDKFFIVIIDVMALYFYRFKKPKKEKLITNAYWEKFHNEQLNDDISIHRGIDSVAGSREGSKQGSILSKLSGSKKPKTLDHASLLDTVSDTDDESLNCRL